MLDPRSISVAVALADTGSATRAARALGVSQPTVSYHVKKLESELQARLFHRSPAGLAPTDAGQVLVSGARKVLGDLERIRRDVVSVASGSGRTVRVSSACFTNYHWLPGVLERFRARHGPIQVELDVDPSRRPFEALDAGALDIALTTVPPEGEDFAVRELFDDEIVAVVHPDHPLACKTYLDPDDFSDQSVVVFDRARSDLFNLSLRPAGVTPADVSDMPVTDALLELVKAGVAVSAMASWIVEPALAAGELRALRIGADGLHRTWWAVTSDRRPTSASAAAFLELLTEICYEPPMR